MESIQRVRWWNYDTGSEYMADWEEDHWTFAEREWAGAQWYPVDATPQLSKEADSLMIAEQAKRALKVRDARSKRAGADHHHHNHSLLAVAG